MDDSAKGRLTRFLGTFNQESMFAQRFFKNTLKTLGSQIEIEYSQKMRNPTWRPTESGERFITTIKEQAMRDSLSMSGSLPYQSGSWNQTAVSSQAPPDLTTFIGPLHYPSLYPSLDPRVEANQRDIVMNTSMMYMHEMRDRAATRSDPVLPRPDQGQSAHGEFPRTWPRYEGLGDQDDDDLLQATEPIGSMTGSAESKF